MGKIISDQEFNSIPGESKKVLSNDEFNNIVIENAKKNPSIWENIKSDIGKRWEEANKNAELMRSGQITKSEYAVRNLGHGAAALYDVAGNVAAPVVGAAVKYSPLGTAYRALPESVKTPIETGLATGIQKGVETYEQNIPERVRKDVEGVVNIASIIPTSALTRQTLKTGSKLATGIGEKIVAGGEKAVVANKVKYAEKLVSPVDTAATKLAKVGRTSETGVGPFKRSVVELTPLEKQSAIEVSKIPEIVEGNTFQRNYNIIKNTVVKEAVNLENAIKQNNFLVSPVEVVSRLNATARELAASPLIVGDAQKTALRLIEGAKKIIANNKGTGEGLLKARKEFDNWVMKQKPKVFDAASENALTTANRAIRTTLNELLAEKATTINVKQSLAKQSALYNAMDNVAVKASKEADSAIGRVLQRGAEALKIKNMTVQQVAALLGIGGLGAASTFAPIAAALGAGGFVLYQGGKFILKPQARMMLGNILKAAGTALDPGDFKVIKTLLEKTKGKPVGLSIEDVSSKADDITKELNRNYNLEAITKAKRDKILGIARSYATYDEFKSRFSKVKDSILKKIFIQSRKLNK